MAGSQASEDVITDPTGVWVNLKRGKMKEEDRNCVGQVRCQVLDDLNSDESSDLPTRDIPCLLVVG